MFEMKKKKKFCGCVLFFWDSEEKRINESLFLYDKIVHKKTDTFFGRISSNNM